MDLPINTSENIQLLSKFKKEGITVETVKQFYEALQADKSMQERANQLNEQYKGTDPAAIDQKAAAAAIVDFAKGEGYDFTATDLEEYQKGMRALDDEELDAVSGGVFDVGYCWCFFGGGGTDPEEGGGGTCACVIGGGGAYDKNEKTLICPILGKTEWSNN